MKSGEARAHAKTIAELQNDIGQEQFAAIYSNLQRYREVVEPNFDEKDRVFISHVQKSIYRTVKSVQKTLQELLHASEDDNSRPEDIRAIEDKLSELGKHLNNFELRLMQSVIIHRPSSARCSRLTYYSRLSLLQFQRLDRDGCVGFVQIPSEQSENLTTTLRCDIEPIKVGYDDDPQLDWPISKGDVTLLESLFDPDQDNTAVS